MIDDQDPVLTSLFAETRHELDGEAFTTRVMARTRFLKYRLAAPWIVVGLALTTGAWFLAVPLETAQLIAQVLTTTLVDLGDGWMAWLLSPINSVAALLALGVKAVRVFQKKIIPRAHANRLFG